MATSTMGALLFSWALKDLKTNGWGGEAGNIITDILNKNGITLPKSKKGAATNPKSKGVGSSGWNDPSMEMTPSTSEMLINDLAIPLVGDAALAIGNSFNAYNSLLGNALLAASKPTGYRSGAVDNILAAPAAMIAGGLGARGTVAKTIGDTLANRAYQFSNNMKQANENARYLQFLQNHSDPSTGYIPGSAYQRVNVNPLNKGGNTGLRSK